MSRPVETYTANRLLLALSEDDLALLKPHLTRVPLAPRQGLVPPERAIEQVYFLESGVASIVSNMPESGNTEVGIFGREGVSATCLLLGTDRSPHETFMQVDGESALRIDTEPYLAAIEQSGTLRTMLLRYVQALLVQTAQTAATTAHHRIESRLARWLLMCHDRVDGD